ncbi:LytTR family transcriptional regulator DNA-binding domain-containing protein [Planococcus sp. CAU13]|uniref:LytTR family transcriptional regulator DNA-binding domain-containing protein n=1 Tax=Planococcus sp. CAU13 TaxID=1541197 RepID=UPI00052FF23A|nr:LytTR family transcriptional regulator DNA-binding domain-containing protein [Planococcus sp. CAU13]
MVLQFKDAEKQYSDNVIFPSFNLLVAAGDITALHTNVNIRQQLMDLLLGTSTLSNGEITFEEKSLSAKTAGIGFFFLESGYYERLSVIETLRFHHNLHNSSQSVDDVLQSVQLLSKRSVKAGKLNHSERKRLQLACLLLQNPDFYVLEEPDQNLDHESKRILFSVLHGLREQNKGILVLTGNMESAVTLGTDVFRLDDKGLHRVETADEEPEASEEPAIHTEEEAPLQPESLQPVRFEKIPTKVNEKIVLFDPPEIDYIESSEGQSFLHIKGEAFPSYFTLTELEDRLLPFGFFRCHRSYIVNLQKVREVITWTKNSYSLVLDDAAKSKIPLSKTKMVSLKEMLGLK